MGLLLSNRFHKLCSDGCFIDRLGCSSPGKINRRNMVISKNKMAYQQVGTTISKASPPNIFQESKVQLIHIQMHNIVALTYLKNMEEIKSQKITILSKEIWEILISKQIMITVEYLLSSIGSTIRCMETRSLQHSQGRNVNSLDTRSLLHISPILSDSRVLSKIKQDQVHTVTLIIPCWQTQLGYP